MSEGTRGQTLLTDVPSPTSPTALARRGWFAAVAAAGTTLLAKLTWPDRAEAQGTPLQVGLPNGATATTTLTGTFPDTLLSLSGNGSAVGLRIENSQTSDQAQPAVLVLGSLAENDRGPLNPAVGGTGLKALGGSGVGTPTGPTSGGTGIEAVGGSPLNGGVPGDGIEGIGGGFQGNTGNGVVGLAASAAAAGVLGRNGGIGGTGPGVRGENIAGGGVGVFALSGQSHGTQAVSSGASGFGCFGEHTGSGAGVVGLSATGQGVAGVTLSPAAWAGAFFGVDQNAPGLFVQGAFVVQGAKSGAVETAHHGTRLLYAVESPESWFEDFGTARLEAGHAVVPLEAIFRETVNADRRYHVFLTPRSAASRGLAVVEQGPDGFAVQELHGGRGSYDFDYRVVAKARGHEARRLERIEPPARPPIPEAPRFEPSLPPPMPLLDSLHSRRR